jgi:hypothetical protein
MWKVAARPDKVVIRHPSVPTSLVIKIKQEMGLIPRWRVSASQTTLAFMSGALLVSGQVLLGAVTGVLALFLAWAAGR